MTDLRALSAAAVAATLLVAVGCSAPGPGPDRDVLESTAARGTLSPEEGAPRAAQTPVPAPARQLGRRLDRLSEQVLDLERVATRLRRWFGCVTLLPVDQAGDRQHRWGFAYDELDGTGLDLRTALVPHPGSSRPDLVMLRLDRRPVCLSQPTDPNGTGADARTMSRGASERQPRTVRRLARKVDRLTGRIEQLERAFDRFDEWESCLSWLPVTEYGDPVADLGFLTTGGAHDGDALGYVPAIDIDDSEWDDPDYEFLAFLGRDRPFNRRECGHEPGESVDRPMPRYGSQRPPVPQDGHAARNRERPTIEDVRHDVADMAEDLEDLVEPAEEFTQFDECMFTVGVRSLDGYMFHRPSGQVVHREALSYDLSDHSLPQMDLLAFPGEEPPQIECNEDAGGQHTDE